MRTVLVCVRTPAAARAVALSAERLAMTAGVRAAVGMEQAMACLADRSADVILADSAVCRADPGGFVRRALRYAPSATVVLLGLDDAQTGSAALAAGARTVTRPSDQDLVTTITKTLLLLTMPVGPAGPVRPGGAPVPPGRPGAAPVSPPRPTGTPGVPVSALGPAGARPGDPGLAGGAARPGAGRPAPASAQHRLLPSAATVLVPAQRDEENRAGRPALTERELQVLRGMADGKSNAEIGRDLFVSEDTVKTHARRLFRKLGARDRAHAVASGFRTGLVT